jgi:hypothetical protein
LATFDLLAFLPGLLFDSTSDTTEYGAVEVTVGKQTSVSAGRLILKRLAAVFVVLLILAAGILIRFYVKVGNEQPPDDCFDWGICGNSTTAFPTPKNVTKEQLFGVFR